MLVYFSTVIRNAPADSGGHLHALDWDAKKVVKLVPIAATNPRLKDSNPRGNTRGGRGIALVNGEVVVCSFHTLKVYDRDLNPRRQITNGLLVGLHEVYPTGNGTLWVTSTAIDAAFEIDLRSGAIVREFWPREVPALQATLDVVPLDIDKRADNRGRFLGSEHTSNPSHLHLNAVARFRGDIYALFNKFGAIVNLDKGVVVVQDPRLRGAHNLLIDDDGSAAVNDSLGQRIMFFDVTNGGHRRNLNLRTLPPIRRIGRLYKLLHPVKVALYKRGLIKIAPPRPFFMRGLDRADGHLFVGLSPAMVLRIDERNGRLVDCYRHARSVRVCVHGLKAVGDGT
jgi:hypothetical protein